MALCPGLELQQVSPQQVVLSPIPCPSLQEGDSAGSHLWAQGHVFLWSQTLLWLTPRVHCAPGNRGDAICTQSFTSS